MKIVDAFIFYNELDLLYYRLKSLYKLVDYFILVEADKTFQNNTKPLYYKENISRYNEFTDKILYVTVKLPDGPDHWHREKTQRNAILNGVNYLAEKKLITENDFIFISDVDEIPDKNILQQMHIEKYNDDRIMSLSQDLYYFTITNKSEGGWFLAKLVKYKTLLNETKAGKSIDDIRHYGCFEDNTHFIKNAGWHLSYFGNTNFIINKIKSFSHAELNTNIDEKNIKEYLEKISIDNHKFFYTAIENNKYLPQNLKLLLKIIQYF